MLRSHRTRVTLLSALASSITLGLVLLLTGWMLWRNTQEGIDRRLEGAFRNQERRIFGEDRPPGQRPSNLNGPRQNGGPEQGPNQDPGQGKGPNGRPGPRDWHRELLEMADLAAFRRRTEQPAPVSSSVYDLKGAQIADVNMGKLRLPNNLSEVAFPPNIAWKVFLTSNKQAQILVATDVADRQEVMGKTYTALLILWPALTALLALATYGAVNSSFRPLHRMLVQAGSLSLHDRLEAEDTAEFGELAASINAYLERIETVVRQQEEFAVDAAHELCTPLTAMRGQLEVALLKKADAREFADAARRAVSQVSRLERLVESLLLAARPKDGDAEVIDVQEVVEEAQARWVDRYAEKHVDLEVTTEPYSCPIRTEELECVIDNLLANALRYSPANSTVSINLSGSGQLFVQDQGPGIAEENHERVFERFERGTSVGRGFGIGLYLARRLLTNRDGSIKIGQSQIGTKVEVTLPSPKNSLS